MKRIVLVFVFAVGSLVAGVTNASAGTYCSTDPTVGVGVPLVKYSVSATALGSDVYLYGNKSSTTFGGGVYIP